MKKTIYLLGLCLCVIFVSAQSKKFDSIANYVDENGFFQYQKSKELIDSLYQMAYNSSDSLKLLAICLAKEVKLYSDHSITDTSLKDKIEHYLLCIDSSGNGKRETMAFDYMFGLYYYNLGDYGSSFINVLKALEQFKQQNDSSYISKSLNLLGMISGRVNQPHLSNKYFTEQLDYVKQNSLEYFSVKQNQYTQLAQDGEIGKFIDSMEYLISKAEPILKEYQLISMYLNLSNAYLAIDSLNIAYKYLMKCDEIIPQIDNDNLKIALYSYFGDYMEVLENYQAALDYYYLAYQLNKDENNGAHLRAIFYGLASCYEEMGEADSIIHYLKKYRKISINERKQSRSVKVYQQYIVNYLELTENQLIIAQQDAELQKRRTTIIVVSLSFALFALLVIIFVIVQQRRRKKAEWKAKEELAEMEKMRQEEIIAAKSREIVSYSLMTSNNHDIWQKIAQLNSQISDAGNDMLIVKEKSQEIEKLIADNQNVEKEWNNVKIHFEKVFPDFFKQLKTMAPNLSKDNLRLCAYIKIGLTTKEIAKILHISPDSVINHRHRIRVKLNLLKEDDLDGFIRNI